MTAYADADWAGGADRKSVSGNVVYLREALVVLRNVKQRCAVLSTTEAEYVSLAGVAEEMSSGYVPF